MTSRSRKHPQLQHKPFNMKSVFLLALSLLTGTEASTEFKTCQEGWMDMTCKYPHVEKKYDKPQVVLPTNTIIQSNQTGKWENSDRFFLYHDTLKKHLRLLVRPSKSKDSGTYYFKFDQDTPQKNKKVKIIVEKKYCKTPLNQTAYRTAETTIRCDSSDLYQSKIKFICKENNFTCKNILTTPSKQLKARFTLTDTSSGFHLSISKVSLNDAGVYWCGVKEKNGSYQAGISKIQLEVKNITIFKRFPTAGQDIKYYCKYSGNVSNLTKFICKGENQNECQHIGSTTKTSMNRRFMMKDNTANKTITITMTEVTAADSGTYWCGAENIDEECSKIFIHKLFLKVATLPVNTSGDMKKYLIIGTVVLMPLLLVAILIILCKRHSNTKNTECRAAEQHLTEEHVYENIQEHQEAPVTAIYANNPTNDPALLPYSIVSFQGTLDNKADTEALLLKPSFTFYSQSSTCLTDQPSRSTDQPLYSIVKNLNPALYFSPDLRNRNQQDGESIWN